MEMAISSATLSVSCTQISRRPTLQFLSFSSTSSSLFKSTPLLTQQKTGLVLGRTRSRSNRGLCCTCLFGLGMPELVVIAGVAALVFGPKKLPEVGRSIGKTVRSFQQAAKEFESELKKEPDSATETSEGKVTEVIEEEKQDTMASTTKDG